MRHVVEEPAFSIEEFVGGLLGELRHPGSCSSSRTAQLALEPGRSARLPGRWTLYSVGGVKHTSAATTFVTIDGGMSDNPRPAMYNARYTAFLANRADETPTETYAVAGKHCESSDVLIERVELPSRRRGDLLGCRSPVPTPFR